MMNVDEGLPWLNQRGNPLLLNMACYPGAFKQDMSKSMAEVNEKCYIA